MLGGYLMKRTLILWPVLLALVGLAFSDSILSAGDIYDKNETKFESIELPKPADVKTLTTYPEKIALKGSDDAQQILITATLDGGRLQDLSSDVKYDVA